MGIPDMGRQRVNLFYFNVLNFLLRYIVHNCSVCQVPDFYVIAVFKINLHLCVDTCMMCVLYFTCLGAVAHQMSLSYSKLKKNFPTAAI
jgi:hypothetical protein